MAISLEYLVVEDAPPAAVITLNRPDQLNALSSALMTELSAELERQAARPEVRAIVIKGAGRAFSAGHDLKEMLDRSLDEEREIFAVCNKLMATVQSVPVPVIAAPHGIATAAGCQLVAQCDLAIASDDCRFATSGVRYGLFCSTPGVAVARNVSRKHAMEMLLTGDFIDAPTAVEWGLGHATTAADNVDADAETLAAMLENPRGDVFEASSEGNNATPSPHPVIIELPLPSDLQVLAIASPAAATSNAPLTITWDVKNEAGVWESSIDALVTSGPLRDQEVRIIIRSDQNRPACFLVPHLWIHSAIAAYNLAPAGVRAFAAIPETFIGLLESYSASKE